MASCVSHVHTHNPVHAHVMQFAQLVPTCHFVSGELNEKKRNKKKKKLITLNDK